MLEGARRRRVTTAVPLTPELLAGEFAGPEAGGELHPGGNLLLAGFQALFPDRRELGDLAFRELQLVAVPECRLGADWALAGPIDVRSPRVTRLLREGRGGEGQAQPKDEQRSEHHVTTSVSV